MSDLASIAKMHGLLSVTINWVVAAFIWYFGTPSRQTANRWSYGLRFTFWSPVLWAFFGSGCGDGLSRLLLGLPESPFRHSLAIQIKCLFGIWILLAPVLFPLGVWIRARRNRKADQSEGHNKNKVSPATVVRGFPEVQATLDALARHMACLDADRRPLLDIHREIVLPGVARLLQNKERVVHLIRVDGKSPSDLALLFISIVAEETIAIGGHGLYLYRGLLTLRGQALQMVFEYAIDGLEASGYHTHEAAEKARQRLCDRIKEAG